MGVYEAVVPDTKDFVKIQNNNVSSLPKASLVRILGAVNVFSLPWYYSGVQTTSNCGLYWEDSSRILYASYYDGYYTQAPIWLFFGAFGNFHFAHRVFYGQFKPLLEQFLELL